MDNFQNFENIDNDDDEFDVKEIIVETTTENSDIITLPSSPTPSQISLPVSLYSIPQIDDMQTEYFCDDDDEQNNSSSLLLPQTINELYSGKWQDFIQFTKPSTTNETESRQLGKLKSITFPQYNTIPPLLSNDDDNNTTAHEIIKQKKLGPLYTYNVYKQFKSDLINNQVLDIILRTINISEPKLHYALTTQSSQNLDNIWKIIKSNEGYILELVKLFDVANKDLIKAIRNITNPTYDTYDTLKEKYDRIAVEIAEKQDLITKLIADNDVISNQLVTPFPQFDQIHPTMKNIYNYWLDHRNNNYSKRTVIEAYDRLLFNEHVYYMIDRSTSNNTFANLYRLKNVRAQIPYHSAIEHDPLTAVPLNQVWNKDESIINNAILNLYRSVNSNGNPYFQKEIFKRLQARLDFWRKIYNICFKNRAKLMNYFKTYPFYNGWQITGINDINDFFSQDFQRDYVFRDGNSDKRRNNCDITIE